LVVCCLDPNFQHISPFLSSMERKSAQYNRSIRCFQDNASECDLLYVDFTLNKSNAGIDLKSIALCSYAISIGRISLFASNGATIVTLSTYFSHRFISFTYGAYAKYSAFFLACKTCVIIRKFMLRYAISCKGDDFAIFKKNSLIRIVFFFKKGFYFFIRLFFVYPMITSNCKVWLKFF